MKRSGQTLESKDLKRANTIGQLFNGDGYFLVLGYAGLVSIVKHLEPSDIERLCQVSKSFNRACNRDDLRNIWAVKVRQLGATWNKPDRTSNREYFQAITYAIMIDGGMSRQNGIEKGWNPRKTEYTFDYKRPTDVTEASNVIIDYKNENFTSFIFEFYYVDHEVATFDNFDVDVEDFRNDVNKKYNLNLQISREYKTDGIDGEKKYAIELYFNNDFLGVNVPMSMLNFSKFMLDVIQFCEKDFKEYTTNEINCQICPNIATSICSRCKNASYCSAECQEKDWSTHHKECSP